MKNWIRFTLVGLCFALVVEVFYKFFAGLNPKAFLISIVFYAIYLQPLYLLHQWLNRNPEGQITRARINNLAFFIIAGLVGLVVLEWGLVGNTPKGNPNASQLGMFLFHAVYPFMARIFVDRTPEARELQKFLLKYYGIFIVVCAAGIAISNEFLRFAWFIYAPLVGSAGLCYFIWRYTYRLKPTMPAS